MKKAMLVILDGLGDRAARELDFKTPLQAASTPNMDKLATMGALGLMDTLAPGVPMETPVAHYVLFGYPIEKFPGRTVFMARGRGLVLTQDQVILAARFATVAPDNGSFKIIQRLQAYEEEDAAALGSSLLPATLEGLQLRLEYTGKSEGIVFIEGGASADICDSDPIGQDLPVIRVQPMEGSLEPEAAARTARAANRYLLDVFHYLDSHPINRQRVGRGLLPINFLLVKWASKWAPLEPFSERFGLRSAAITTDEALCGLFLDARVDVIPWEERRDDPPGDLRQRLAAARDLLREGYDFLYVHSKEPDISAHKSDARMKASMIEALDGALDGLVAWAAEDRELVLVLTGDHSTPSLWGDHRPGQHHDHHCGDPVPLLMVGEYVRRDELQSFDEIQAARGAIGRIKASDLMNIIVDHLDRSNSYTWRPSRRKALFRPRRVEPLMLVQDAVAT